MSPDQTAPFEAVRSGFTFVCIPGHVEQGEIVNNCTYKQYEPRPDCSRGSSPIKDHICLHTRTCGAGVDSKQLFLQAKWAQTGLLPLKPSDQGSHLFALPGHVEQGYIVNNCSYKQYEPRPGCSRGSSPIKDHICLHTRTCGAGINSKQLFLRAIWAPTGLLPLKQSDQGSHLFSYPDMWSRSK